MATKIGINGFGRIGRVVLRILSENPEKFDICGINLRKADIDYMVYQVKYDFVTLTERWSISAAIWCSTATRSRSSASLTRR